MLNRGYDYIICGAGVSGCVLARRLSEDPSVSVLLLEAGGSDDLESVRNPAAWAQNLATKQDWQFINEPAAELDGRTLMLSMGKVLGGGSSINALQWARGHQNDWNYFAQVAEEPSWNYEHVCDLYNNVERRPGQKEDVDPSLPAMWVEPASSPDHEEPLLVKAARANGIPTFQHPNGRMLEGAGGAAVMDTIVHCGARHSVYQGYLYPILGRANLTIATGALLTRLVIERGCAIAVEVEYEGTLQRVAAGSEVVLCLGAVNTPKVLMLSGIGPAPQLEQFGISVEQNLPGVGQNFQDHPLLFGCAWRFDMEGVVPNASRAVLQWKTDPALSVPNIQINQSNGGTLKNEMEKRGLELKQWWSLAPALIQPFSRGHIELTGPGALDPVRIFGNYLADPRDLQGMVDAVDLCRDLAQSSALQKNIGPELLPATRNKEDLKAFVRQRVGTFWHQSCTAKMGSDADSVVNGRLQVHGVQRLRIADASVFPRITAGNTMAPCIIVGENASRFIEHHNL